MDLLEIYVRELREIRSFGSAVKETSYYGSLAHLLNRVGATLKPRVLCVINSKNRGAGIPDGGLFTPDQYASGNTIGGYQAIKKWLFYREEPVLGRSLTGTEAREVWDIVHRIAVLRLLEPLLDANYATVKRSVLPLGAAG